MFEGSRVVVCVDTKRTTQRKIPIIGYIPYPAYPYPRTNMCHLHRFFITRSPIRLVSPPTVHILPLREIYSLLLRHRANFVHLRHPALDCWNISTRRHSATLLEGISSHRSGHKRVLQGLPRSGPLESKKGDGALEGRTASPQNPHEGCTALKKHHGLLEPVCPSGIKQKISLMRAA